MNAHLTPGGIYRINLVPLLKNVAERIGEPIIERTIEAEAWRFELSHRISRNYHRLYGGYSNLVLKNNQTPELIIVWRDTQRWPDLLRSIVTEDVMSRHLDIPGRQLQDPQVPLEILDGYLISRAIYVEGFQAYPWNSKQIASAAKLMGRVHVALQHLSFDQRQLQPTMGHQLIHRDFARNNVLFDPDGNAHAVIDWEFMDIGSREQNIGRTASFLLVDSQVWNRAPGPEDYEVLVTMFEKRLGTLFENYPLEYDSGEALAWCLAYLQFDRYGDLSAVRDMAVRWMKQRWNFQDNPHIPQTDPFNK